MRTISLIQRGRDAERLNPKYYQNQRWFCSTQHVILCWISTGVTNDPKTSPAQECQPEKKNEREGDDRKQSAFFPSSLRSTSSDWGSSEPQNKVHKSGVRCLTDFGVQKHPFYGETFSPFRSRGRLWRNFSHFERSLNIEWAAEKEQATLRPLMSVIVDPLTPLRVIQIPFSRGQNNFRIEIKKFWTIFKRVFKRTETSLIPRGGSHRSLDRLLSQVMQRQ